MSKGFSAKAKMEYLWNNKKIVCSAPCSRVAVRDASFQGKR